MLKTYIFFNKRWAEWFRCCLDEGCFGWYDPKLITHHPKLVGPTKKMLFGLHHSVLVTLFWWFYHSKIWVMRHKKKKQVSIVFNFHHPWFSGISVNRVHQWAPRAVLCPITLCYDRWNWALNTTHSSLKFFFPQKFPPSHFPLLTSLSQPRTIFTSLLTFPAS